MKYVSDHPLADPDAAAQAPRTGKRLRAGLVLTVRSKTNKQAAYELGATQRTVKAHHGENEGLKPG
jgi:hypothetical protein